VAPFRPLKHVSRAGPSCDLHHGRRIRCVHRGKRFAQRRPSGTFEHWLGQATNAPDSRFGPRFWGSRRTPGNPLMTASKSHPPSRRDVVSAGGATLAVAASSLAIAKSSQADEKEPGFAGSQGQISQAAVGAKARSHWPPDGRYRPRFQQPADWSSQTRRCFAPDQSGRRRCGRSKYAGGNYALSNAGRS
jgi:hypothetical protein